MALWQLQHQHRSKPMLQLPWSKVINCHSVLKLPLSNQITILRLHSVLLLQLAGNSQSTARESLSHCCCNCLNQCNKQPWACFHAAVAPADATAWEKLMKSQKLPLILLLQLPLSSCSSVKAPSKLLLQLAGSNLVSIRGLHPFRCCSYSGNIINRHRLPPMLLLQLPGIHGLASMLLLQLQGQSNLQPKALFHVAVATAREQCCYKPKAPFHSSVETAWM